MEQADSRAHAPASARLLPWPTPEGKPCYLVTDNSGSYLSRLADDMEATQLATGTDVLAHARQLLDDPMSPYAEVRYAGIRLAECLTDALRIAESRGRRLGVLDNEQGREIARRRATPKPGNGPGA
ncbi:hypothetical protein ACWDFR_27365 [Streptomyces sp. 900105755]|uniref:hypothetical protein n=1 Tax=Streptomyces sp. NPDC001507 TaxID=3364579 RepID=UPI0036984A6C